MRAVPLRFRAILFPLGDEERKPDELSSFIAEGVRHDQAGQL
jgi:hypothetical protein